MSELLPERRMAAGWAKPRRIRVCPSVLSADFARLGEQLSLIERAGADFLHVDVMDGQFVPDITFGPILIEAMRRLTALPLDVHLMVADPLRFVDAFARAGSDHLTVHVEAVTDSLEAVRIIRANGMRAGLSIKPKTPVERILPALSACDVALLMTVEPGAGGQTFLDGSLERIAALRAAIDAQGLDCLVGVDGGIGLATGPRALKAGADTFVAGHSVFRTPDPVAALAALRRSLEAA